MSTLKISSLPQKLYLASVSKDAIESCTKVILQLAFFTQRTNTFFSYTETEEEISFVLDDKSITLFETVVGHNPITVTPGVYRAIQVYEGANALNETGVISKLTGPISQAKISMIYLSTFNTDLILIPEEKHDEALRLLNQVSTPTGLHMIHDPGTQVFLTVLPDTLAIVNFKTQDIRSSCFALLQQLIFPTSPSRFFSFTGFPTETSMIVDHKMLDSFPSGVLDVHHTPWVALEVHVGTTGESGMNVNMLSGLLAQAGISIYYLSTFHTDFILVPLDSVQRAIDCFKSNLSIIVEEK